MSSLPPRADRCIVAAVVSVVLFTLAAVPTVVRCGTGDCREREMFASTSPDGRYRVSVTTRVALPANELLDPAIMVGMFLRDARSGKERDYLRVEYQLDEPIAGH